MANSLKRNIEITRDNFIKNMEVCWGHAKGVIQTSAVKAAMSRNDPVIQAQHHKQFDEAHAVVEWLEKVKKLVNECPVLSEHPSEQPQAHQKPPVQIEQ